MSLKPIIPPGLYNGPSGATYDPTNVAITGGTINGTTIGGTTPAAGAFTTLTVDNVNNNAFHYALGLNGLELASDTVAAWSSISNCFGAKDVILLRDAANTLALRNGANAQAFNIYQSYTDASNYRRGTIIWATSSRFILGLESAGTGNGVVDFELSNNSGGKLRFATLSGFKWDIAASGELLAAADNTYDIGASGANRPRDIFVGRNLQLGNAAATGLVAGALAALTTASIVIYDSTGTAYRVPCVTP